MGKKARKPYEDMSAADQDRFDEEMMNYVPDRTKDLKRQMMLQQVKAPKPAQWVQKKKQQRFFYRLLAQNSFFPHFFIVPFSLQRSAFTLFFDEESPALDAEYSNATITLPKKVSKIANEIMTRWGKLGPERRAHYQSRADHDKMRFEKVRKVWSK